MHKHLITDPNDQRCGQPKPDDELSAAEKESRRRAQKREHEWLKGRMKRDAKKADEDRVIDEYRRKLAKEAREQ